MFVSVLSIVSVLYKVLSGVLFSLIVHVGATLSTRSITTCSGSDIFPAASFANT